MVKITIVGVDKREALEKEKEEKVKYKAGEASFRQVISEITEMTEDEYVKAVKNDKTGNLLTRGLYAVAKMLKKGE